ncbi:hypothetical protein AIOL_000482 [Candidatus Rhodobacter oscarellae]|uniref:Uncharacterized protein n=1 Tax=Candidatus Rhodobacter oscarellae TaxID=1675527 RepID=A0A0J9EF73_9RHOB|nr:hypothetical protein [Candidatus Rhodobacter lobularis]KMW60329.1 hypothetical protein AIOL_000482 [Candidatus Rhodobacter lobularis]
MIQPEPIGWWNTGFPLLVLAGLAVILPRVLVRRDTRSHREVAVVIWASAGLILLAGAVVFALTYQARGVGLGAFLAEAPVGTAWFFLRLSGYTSVVWAPILALVWFVRAQGVERRKGQDLAKRDGKGA